MSRRITARGGRHTGWVLMLAGAAGALAVASAVVLGTRHDSTVPGAAAATSAAPATATPTVLPPGVLGTPPPPLQLRPRLLGGSVLGRLTVPGLSRAIDVVEGLVEAGDAIGHDDTSAYPGEPHAMVLQAGSQVSLGQVPGGGIVQLAAVYGVFRYRVTSVGPAPPASASADAPELRLLTGPATQRTQLTATLVPGDAQTAAELQEEVDVAQAQQHALAAGLVGATAPQTLLAPCQGPLSQPFGPVEHAFEFPFVYQGVYYPHFHTGIDIAVPLGTPIRATAAGTVVLATTNVAAGVPVGYGTYVLIAHGGGVYSLYGHLGTLRVRAGQQVAAGQVVGLSGSTGNSTGPHLHFEIRRGTTPVDPLPLLG